MRLLTAARRAVRAAPILLLLLVGCRSVVPVPDHPQPSPPPSASLQQQLVVMVHGDASYLYHDGQGRPHQADEETLREVFTAARSMQRAELFVVHQRPADPLFGLLPRDDGTLYHFRRGRLVRQTTYTQDRSDPLSVEAEWIRSHRTAVNSSVLTAALYYGHAVPERPRAGYHRSRPDAPFGVEALAWGLDRFRPPGSSFDALVLSTCDGGTPHTVSALAPYAHHLLAAPGDLHLSFVDGDLLADLSSETDPALWTRRLAEQAFDRLTGRTVTATALATYDLDRAGPIARRMARGVPPDTSVAAAGARHVDCRTVLGGAVDTAGVRVWYRPARFGPRADRPSHSGWACVPPPSPAPEEP